MNSNYSQNNEQEIIFMYFNGRIGNFIDFGANDGMTLSNTYALAFIGWHGLCVEPSPAAYAKLCELYADNKKITRYNVAIANENGKVVLFHSDEHLGRGDISLLSSIKKEETFRWGSTQKFEPIEVEGWTVEKFLEAMPFKKIDFISIDCEGMDLDILRKLNLKELECSMICIEHNGNEEVLKEVQDICNGFGLTNQLLKNAENIIWAI